MNATEQAAIIENFISEGVDGMAIAGIDLELTGELINEALDAGIPVMTFDSDVPDSKRLAFIGTNNTALGYHVGKVLEQLRPEGGKYGIISGYGLNLAERVEGVRDRLRDSKWIEVDESPRNAHEPPFVLEQDTQCTTALVELF